MIALASSIKKHIPVALALGFFGGVALIITTELTANGHAIFIPYSVLLIFTFATLRLAKWPEFSRRFSTAFLAFMVATIILYIFIGTIAAGTIFEISVWGHVWRIGLIATIGGILSLAVAYLANIGREQPNS